MSEININMGNIRGEIEALDLEYVPVHDEFGGGIFFHPDEVDGEAIACSDNHMIRNILGKVGFVFDDSRFSSDFSRSVTVGVTDVERFISATACRNIPVIPVIEVIDDVNPEIPVVTFVETHRAGFYPVGINNLELYIHDTSFDHIPAFIICGKALIEIFKQIPEITQHEDYIAKGENIDDATTEITDTILSIILEWKDDIDDGINSAASSLSELIEKKLKPENLKKIIYLGLDELKTRT